MRNGLHQRLSESERKLRRGGKQTVSRLEHLTFELVRPYLSVCISAAPAALDRYLTVRRLPDRSSHSLHSLKATVSGPSRIVRLMTSVRATCGLGSNFQDSMAEFVRLVQVERCRC